MDNRYDVIVIGGGVNGTGIARDCAMRGIKTLLVEKDDFGAGTTGASSGMIHGGARYMLHDVETTKKSCLDSGYIQKIAHHLIFRIPFLIPVTSREKFSRINLNLIDAYFEAYDKFAVLKGGKPHTRLTKEQALRIEPGLRKDLIGAVTMDEWGIDSHRLCLLNALSAREHGAAVLKPAEVVGFLIEGRRAKGIRVSDNGRYREVFAKLIVNASGPWIMNLSRGAGLDVKIRPGKGVHLVFERRYSNYGVIAKAVDGRQIFIIPYKNMSLLGTTDDDYYGDPDNQSVTQDEVEYLLQGMESALPDIRNYRIISTTSGIRVTLFEWGKNEDDLSRCHRVFDHEKVEGISGIISIAGGKLASYRLMSEEATDLACEKLGINARCRTHLVPLPGGEEMQDPEEIGKQYGIPAFVARRLIARYGARIHSVMEAGDATGRSPVCICESVLEAEIRYAVRKEMAKSLLDLSRRTGFGTGPCHGAQCLLRGSWILAEELKLSIDEMDGMIQEFLQKTWQKRMPVLNYNQAPQEEMNRFIFQLWRTGHGG